MSDGIVTPAQIRAARALLGWSQEQLANAAGVGLSTVKDAESGKRDPIASNVRAIRTALEQAGAKFIPGNGDGPGVRLAGRQPQIIRRPTRVYDDAVSFRVAWRDQKVNVKLSTDVLDDLDRTGQRGEAELLASFVQHERVILSKVAASIEAGRVDEEGWLELGPQDFIKN